MRISDHQLDPHTMTIDGRDVSQDGSKLDTIQAGAQVNNLSDIQAQSLTSGSNSNWHTHDARYFTKGELQTSGSSQVHWGNLTSIPATFTPSVHNHDDLYYTETESDAKYSLLTHLHDDRYYTESEIDGNIYTKIELDAGQLDNRYYTETEINTLLTDYSLTSHLHDDRYYTESETDNLLSNYSLTSHLHDDRYYTESEIDSSLNTKIDKISSPTLNNFVMQLESGNLVDSGTNSSTFSLAVHSHATSDITSGTLPLVRGGTNNDTYISAKFIAFDGTKLSSTTFSNTSFAAASHNHSATNITSGTLVIARGGTNATSFTANKFIIFNGTSLVASSYDWNNFSLVGHTHTKSNITDFVESDYVHITGSETITGNKIFSGDVTIQGTLTNVNSTDLSVSDNEIILNSGEIGSGVSDGYSGLAIGRGTLDNAFLRFDEVDDKWKIGIGTNLLTISTNDHFHDDRYFTESEITSLLTEYSLTSHLHDDRYFTESEINTLLSDYYTKFQIDSNIYTKTESDSLFSAAGHFHDDRYFTELESDLRYSLISHLHDDRYYTESEITSLLSGYSLIFHLHDDRYYTETELQTSGSSQVHWGNLISVPSTFTPSVHLHDDRYYTESEIISLLSGYSLTSHLHDDRYFTESEITSLLSGYSITTHLHDDRYYTESEIDSLLSGKSNTGHSHDDRYFTESEITSNYYSKTEIDTNIYTKTQLNGGQLDNRYYTETELNNGQLDSRYFTETEINNSFYTKAQLNAGQLNNLYYTETELNNQGAQLIGIAPISGLTADNVQTALEEINTTLSSTSSTLQDAYDNGNTITISTATVKIQSTNANAPLELSNMTLTPSANLAAGQIAVIENELYIYDGGRSKWITPSKTLLFGKDGGADGTNLRPVGQSPSSSTGYRMSKNGVILGATLNSTSNISKNVYIRLNGSNVYTMSIVGGVFNLSNLNINFNLNDVLSVYVDAAGGSINDSTCVIEFGWRK